MNQDLSTKVKENKEDVKLLPSTLKKNDRLNENEYAKL